MFRGVAIALLALWAFTPCAPAQGVTGVKVIILLRLSGESGALPQIRSCLTSKLTQMPDIEIATAPIDGVRFIVDIIAAKGDGENLLASMVITETFPMEEFRPRVKDGEDGDALLTSLRFYTLLRLHELVPTASRQTLCTKIAAEIANKVLATEYTERND